MKTRIGKSVANASKRSWSAHWRRRLAVRRMIRTTRTLLLGGVVVVGVVAIAPSTWDEVKRMVHESHGSVEDAIGSAAERTTDFLSDGAGVVRDALEGQVADAALTGSARIIDGDTLDVRGSRVRLHGIDAPESAQRCRSGGRFWSCGHEATRALSRRIGSRPVACEERDRDRYGRSVAVCWVGGEDVNAWMVAEGWAFAYRKYSMRYVAEEMAAKSAKRGVWRGDVVAPWDWRRGKRLADTGTTVKRGSGRCDIKGNISKAGKRIYHVPGGRFYNQTRINTSRGERWFCSEAEARAAGWRRSRQ